MSLQHPLMFLLLTTALVLLSIRRLAGANKQIFLILSLLFIGLQYRWEPLSLAVLAAIVGIHYLSVWIMLRLHNERHRSLLFTAWFILIVAAFVIIRQYDWLMGSWLPDSLRHLTLASVGLSFLLFRQIHISIEVRDGSTESVPLLTYLNYNLALWTFLAGPIQRFDDFCEQFDAMTQRTTEPEERATLLALNRILIGLIKMFVVGAFFEQHSGAGLFITRLTAANLAWLLLAYPLYVYINFSGYCDIMIGLAAAVGFQLPENFNHPYIARNSVDFWNRWHITMSQFFRDYLYFPLYFFLARKRVWGWLATGVAVLCSFSVMGAWHGPRFGFVAFGMIHAVGVIVTMSYDWLLRKKLSRASLAKYERNRAIHAVSVLGFQAFVVLSFLPFQFDGKWLSQILTAVRKVWGIAL